MRRVAPFLLLAAVFAALPQGALGQTDGSSVLVVKVDGSIDGVVTGYVIRSIEDAEARGSTVILQLDSAGTLDGDPVALAERVHDATVPVIVWVGPAPAKAQGAGLLLMYAASLAAVAPGAGMGPLHPLDLAREEPPSTSMVENLALGWMEDRGRTVPPLFPDEPVPARDALDGGVAELAAVSITDLLDRLEGRIVTTAEGSVTLHTRIARTEGEEPVTVRFTDLGPGDRVLHAAASPTWIYVLLVLGLAGLAFELTQPGFGFAGFAGLGMVALGVYGLTVVPFSWPGLVLLVGGIGLMTLDVRVRRLGALTAAGLLSFVAGSVVLFGGVADEIDVSPWLTGTFSALALLYWGFGLTVAIQTRERLTSTQKGLVGLVGEARGELKPEGPVYVKGTLWRGRSTDGPIAAGARIRVRGVDGLILRVEADPGPPAQGGAEPDPS